MEGGAFHTFRHEHRLEPLLDNGSRMTDLVSWTSPWGVLGRLADAVVVRRALTGLIADRNAEIERRVVDDRAAQCDDVATSASRRTPTPSLRRSR